MYIQEQHASKTRTILSSPTLLNTPESQDWTLSFWLNVIYLKRPASSTARFTLKSITGTEAVEVGLSTNAQQLVDLKQNTISQGQRTSTDSV